MKHCREKMWCVLPRGHEGVCLSQVERDHAEADPDARIYPCDDCGTMRSKSEGGTVFTVCEKCWDKRHDVKTAGKPVSREEALRISRATLERAERERADIAEQEASRTMAKPMNLGLGPNDEVLYIDMEGQRFVPETKLNEEHQAACEANRDRNRLIVRAIEAESRLGAVWDLLKKPGLTEIGVVAELIKLRKGD